MSPTPTSSVFHEVNEAPFGRQHWRTIFTTGMGFFTDAYDLFVIGTATAILTPLWHLTPLSVGVLDSVSLLASVLGAMVFGTLADRLGRKAMYGVEAILLVVGALLSALTGNIFELIACRALLGIGVGGDYASSAVITSEFANRTGRGKMIGLVFAMQGFGLLAGPLVAAGLLSSGMSPDIAWRVMLGAGAIPAISVIYLRRKIKETPRYAIAAGDAATAKEAVAWITGGGIASEPGLVSVAQSTSPPLSLWKDYRRRLFGTMTCWFLVDVVFYGNSISLQLILKVLLPHAALVTTTLVAVAIFAVFALPGYWVGLLKVDKAGRRRIQIVGFCVVALAYAVIAGVPGVIATPFVFLAIYGVSYFFVECGPNLTTFIFPAEIFPTELRGRGYGFSAGAGKTGAFIGALVMPSILASFHLAGVMVILTAVALLGVVVTTLTLPETAGKSLEEISGEGQGPRTAPRVRPVSRPKAA